MSTIDWPRERKKRIHVWHFESERVVSFPWRGALWPVFLFRTGPKRVSVDGFGTQFAAIAFYGLWFVI